MSPALACLLVLVGLVVGCGVGVYFGVLLAVGELARLVVGVGYRSPSETNQRIRAAAERGTK